MNSQGDLGILKVLTENPELMQKAMSIASSLASSGALSGLNLFGGGDAAPSAQPSPPPSSPPRQSEPSIASLLGALGAGGAGGGSQMPSASPVTNALEQNKSEHKGASHKDRIRLLEAMRPFVPSEKREKLEFVIRLLGLIQVADQLGLKNIIDGR